MEIIKSIQNEINYNLENLDLNKIIEIKNILLNEKNKNRNIFFSGIGKCETIAIHLTNLLKSLSYKTFFINIQNSSHGDIGCIDNDSIVMLFSKSGNTHELLNFIEISNLKKLKIISITCNENCKMKDVSYYHYALPLKSELDYGIINVPTNSSVLMLIFSNILVKLLDNIDINEYKLNHIGGSIGNELKKIKDLMIVNFPSFIFKNNEKLKMMDIVLEMTNKKMGLAIIKDTNEEIIGMITDGDIRRLLINDNNLIYLKKEFINTSFFKIENKELIIKDIKYDLLKKKFIPIVEKNKIIGLLCENLLKN